MIFLVGPHGAGKTEAARVLASLGFLSIDLGPTLRSIHRREDPSTSFSDWVMKKEVADGSDFTDKLLARELQSFQLLVEGNPMYTDIVVVGSRSRRGVEYLQDTVPRVNGRENQVVFLDAPFDVLHSRYNARERRHLTVAEFQGVLDRDLALGLESLRSWAGFHIQNTNTILELEEQLLRFVHALSY